MLLTWTGGDWEQGLGCYMQCKCIDVFFVLTLPPGLFMIMFSIISMDFFGLEAVESGYLMSYFGVLQMVSEVQVPCLEQLATLLSNSHALPNPGALLTGKS